MGLFSSRSRLSFGSSNVKQRERRRKAKSHSAANDVPGTVYINVGEAETFNVKVDNARKFTIIHETDNSLVAKVSYIDKPEKEILKVHWASTQRESCDRDHIPSLMIGDYISVPKYRTKDTYRHYNTFVTVGMRSYIKGHTLASVISELPDDDFESILEQVQGVVWKLGEKQSPHFGHIQYNGMRTETPAAYLVMRVVVDKLTARLDASDWKETGKDMYRCPAIMCHGNLSPDHIILRGSTVVGIVGWGRGDFMPEVYDRLRYYFMSDPQNPRCWYRKLADITMTLDSGRPSVEFIINATEYAYKNRWRNVPEREKATITRLYRTVCTNYTIVNCLALATEIEGDCMSLSSLTSWWNESERTVTQ